MHIDWNDLQTLEALVRVGTLEGAARALGLTHTSVSRRLSALEARLATPLFVRGARLVPTPLAREIAARAGPMEASAAAVSAVLARARREREERIVVTTNDVLAPLLFRALARVPRPPHVEVVVDDAELVLGPGEVDLALRPGADPSGALRGRRLGALAMGVFGPVDGGGEDRWVLPDAALRARRSMSWWHHLPDDAPGGVTCNTLSAMRDACAAGLGCAVLPAFLLTGDTRVRRLRELPEGPAVWLLAPPTDAARPIARRFRAALVSTLVAVDGAFVAR